MVNAFMKRLAEKGYFKMSTVPKNKIKYLLTPRGAREKSRLAYEYIQYSIGFYREIKKVLLALFAKLQSEGIKRIALCGCGEVAELAFLFLQNTNIVLAGVYDEDSDGQKFYGHPVQDYTELVKASYDYVLLTETEDIQNRYDFVVRAGVEPERILHLKDQIRSNVS
jgi:hypothetical protein